ncbi:MAG TPA: Rieske 2Fe-2S domain-containing protein [Gemmataceae bacterium]|jgi:nitrite reductase (NADH) small subunit/3-phenylpropionate/trans-cinnamate dioxygenase ferredoxin subunit|nr:Rieske 2Fe-2S domain-containing protein [Gemmataceae bacterium]
MPKFVTVAKVGDIAEGEAVTVVGPSKAISVFRDGDGYFAIDDMCPHMGASLAGGFVEDGIVTCPWHYWRFRLADGAWADNPRIKIGCYPVQVVADEIRVELPEAIEGSKATGCS